MNRNEERPITFVWMESLCPSGKGYSSCYATLKAVRHVIELPKALLFAAVFVFAVIGIGAAVAVLCIATDGRAAMLKVPVGVSPKSLGRCLRR